MDILALEHVGLRVEGRPILDDLSLRLHEGRIHALVGPNGAGKSTLAGAVMGLQAYRGKVTGRILYRGEPIGDLTVDERARRGITLAWQEPARFEGLTVERFIAAAAGGRGGEGDPVGEALASVGLDPDRYRRRAADRTLSGGERKKLEMASILAMRPRLVLLDEPDSGIDVASLGNIFDSLALLRERGATVVLITHSPTVLRRAEHAFLMCCGRIVDQGDVERIWRAFEGSCLPCDGRDRLGQLRRRADAADAAGVAGREPSP